MIAQKYMVYHDALIFFFEPLPAGLLSGLSSDTDARFELESGVLHVAIGGYEVSVPLSEKLAVLLAVADYLVLAESGQDEYSARVLFKVENDRDFFRKNLS